MTKSAPSSQARASFAYTAGSGDHPALEHLGDLDGRHADAAGGGQHQNIFTRLEARPRHQHVPGGEEYQRSGGGFFETEIVGNGNDAVLGRGQQFGVAAVFGIAEHGEAAAKIILAKQALLALTAAQPRRKQHAPARFDALAQFAHLDHFPGNVAAQDVRHSEFHAGNAGADEQVETVQCAGADPHQHFVGFDLRIGNFFVDQHLGSAVLVDARDFHQLKA